MQSPVIYFSPRQFFAGRLDLVQLSVKFQLPKCSVLGARPGSKFCINLFFMHILKYVDMVARSGTSIALNQFLVTRKASWTCPSMTKLTEEFGCRAKAATKAAWREHRFFDRK